MENQRAKSRIWVRSSLRNICSPQTLKFKYIFKYILVPLEILAQSQPPELAAEQFRSVIQNTSKETNFPPSTYIHLIQTTSDAVS